MDSKITSHNTNCLFAILRQDSYNYSLATAESAYRRWKFINKFDEIKSTDDMDTTILSSLEYYIKIPWQGGVRYDNETYIARYYDGLLEFKNGKKFRKIDDNHFFYSLSFIDTDTNEPIIEINEHYGFKSIASVKINNQSFDHPELLLLMILGCQIILIHQGISSFDNMG